jgi:hypothetical protein
MYQCWQKMGWATFWAIFFTKSSDHPAGSTQWKIFEAED